MNVANLRLVKLDTAIGRADWDAAEEALVAARAAVEAYVRWDSLDETAFDLQARCDHAWTILLCEAGRLDEAEQRVREALRNLQFARSSEDDDRQLLEDELALTRELAIICERVGKLQEAADLLEPTLQLRRRALVGQMSPAEVMSHSMFTSGFEINDYLRPIGFCDYVNDQLRLSELLRGLNRPHRAELLLAEAERRGLILAQMFPSSPRYHAALANTYADLALLLQASRPEESQLALDRAVAVWKNATQEVPDIARYRSGLRFAENDLEWFNHQFPEAMDADRVKSDSNSHAFLRTDSHFSGIYLLEAGLTDAAISYFEKSLKQSRDVPAYDWLYLALAHQERGNMETSQHYYVRASEWLEQHALHDEELAELFERVESSIATAVPRR